MYLLINWDFSLEILIYIFRRKEKGSQLAPLFVGLNDMRIHRPDIVFIGVDLFKQHQEEFNLVRQNGYG